MTGIPDIQELSTLRLKLRPLVMTDLQECYQIRADENVMRYQSELKLDISIQETREWLATRIGPPSCCFAIEEVNESGNQFSGWVGCHSFDPRPACGFTLSRQCWGKGYATEAFEAWLEMWWNHLSHVLHLERAVAESDRTLMAYCLAENVQSQRVLTKCGFQMVLEERLFYKERWINATHWELKQPARPNESSRMPEDR